MFIRVYSKFGVLGFGNDGVGCGRIYAAEDFGVLGQGLPHALLPQALPRLLRDRDGARAEASSA